MFNRILFDFDGTLMDTSEGVFRSFERVIEHYGLEVPRSDFPLMMGPPLKESFTNILKLPPSETENAMKVYREYYTREGMFQAHVYDGVEHLIRSLRRAGKRVYVATSKPEIYAREILRRQGMEGLFDFVGGSDTEEKTRVEKCDIIRYVLSSADGGSTGGDARLDECLLIGDRRYDVQGAHAARIKCAGVLWGFGTKEEFEECGADFIFETPHEVECFLLGDAADK